MAEKRKKQPKKADAASVITDEQKFLLNLQRDFTTDFHNEKPWRKKRAEWNRFYDGDQLSTKEKEALRKRNQPEVVINRIKPVVDGISGIQLGAKTMIRAFDRGLQDFMVAKHITEAIRYIEYHSGFEDAQCDAFEDGIIGGRSWYKHELMIDEDLETEFIVSKPDPDDIVLDCNCKKPDLSDAKRIHETIWSTVEDAQELFERFAKDIDSAANSNFAGMGAFGDEMLRRERPDQYNDLDENNVVPMKGLDNFRDSKNRLVRITSTWYRKPKRIVRLFDEDMGAKDITSYSDSDREKLIQQFPKAVVLTDVHYTLNCAIWAWNKLLEHKKDIRHWDKAGKFPFVLVPAFVTRDKKRMPYGHVKQMMDPQKEVNKRRSKMLHLLNVNQIEMEEGAVEDVEYTRAEAAKPDGILVHRPDREFKVNRGVEIAGPHFQLLQEAKQEIEETGVNREITGSPATASASGRQIQLRQSQVVQVLRKLFKNLRGSHKRIATLWLEDMQHFWTGEKLVRITDDPAAAPIKLNERVKDPATGEIEVRNNISLGKYDLIIEETPDTLNIQQETFQTLVDLANGKVPIPPDMLIEASPLPNKNVLLDRMKKQQAAAQAAAAGQGAGAGIPQAGAANPPQ